MSLNVLSLLGKYVVAFFVSAISFFGLGGYKENTHNTKNSQLNINGPVVSAISYETDVTYNEKRPSNITNVLKNGEVGISYYDSKSKKTIIVSNSKTHYIEKGTGPYGIYKGKLVGYGPDCPGCSSEGNVACKTKDKQKHSLVHNGIYYEDDEYGKVRILAADLNEFPCGTIVKVEKESGESFLAVILDRIGVTLPDQTLMDLAYPSQNDKTVFAQDGLLGPNMTFSIQRWGF